MVKSPKSGVSLVSLGDVAYNFQLSKEVSHKH